MVKKNPKALSVDVIRIDAETQSRCRITEDVVEDYAEVIAEANGDWPLPPIDVFHDGSEYFAADGFHRLLAAQRAHRASIPCTVHKGTARDARIFGMTANDRHGLRMSREDKRACVEWLLDQPGRRSQTQVADMAGVSRRTVATIVADRKPKSVQTSQPSGGGGSSQSVQTSQPSEGVEEGAIEPEKPSPEPPKQATLKGDFGKCPNCAGSKWVQDEEGIWCAKCHHPHGEPAGETDEDRLKTQRSKTVKTAEALMRAFDDLQIMKSNPKHDESIEKSKELITTAQSW